MEKVKFQSKKKRSHFRSYSFCNYLYNMVYSFKPKCGTALFVLHCVCQCSFLYLCSVQINSKTDQKHDTMFVMSKAECHPEQKTKVHRYRYGLLNALFLKVVFWSGY